eukprot:462960-Hanusia_phi.AAC.1
MNEFDDEEDNACLITDLHRDRRSSNVTARRLTHRPLRQAALPGVPNLKLSDLTGVTTRVELAEVGLTSKGGCSLEDDAAAVRRPGGGDELEPGKRPWQEAR